MIDFERSRAFADWLDSLKDTIGKARIIARLRSAEHGNFGDCEPVGAAVYEMRVHYGPGYRMYFTRRGEVVYLLLVGGDKSTQKRDIKRAIQMAQNIGNEEQVMTEQFTRFDAAEFLKTPEEMAAYLDACFDEDAGDGVLIRAALNDIARAQGMTQVARDAGLGRESLYKALGSTGNPEFATIMKVMKALGLRLHAVAL